MTSTTTRRVKLKSVKVHGWEGQGPTAAEAKADAVRQIEAAAEGYYSTRVITFRGQTAILTRHPAYGWEYFLIDADGRPFGVSRAEDGRTHVITASSSHADLAESERRARHHLAQNGFQMGENPAEAAAICSPDDRRDFWTWAIWQNACKAYRDARPDFNRDDHTHDAAMRAHGDSVQRAWRDAD